MKLPAIPSTLVSLLLVSTLLTTARIDAQGSSGKRSSAGDSGREARVMRLVAGFLERAHLTDRKLDDELSRRAFDDFIEKLDPLKLYFLNEDVVALNDSREDLDDMLRVGKTEFAKSTWKLYMKRLTQRVDSLKGILEGEFDFTKDDSFVTDFETANYPKTDEEARVRWRRRIKYDFLRLKLDKVDAKEARKRLTRRYASLQRRMGQLDDEDILSMFITSVATGFDPHTSYMSRRTLENFEIHMRLNYQGIGARLTDEDGYTTISSIMPGGAAAKQGGLEAGDKIVSVGQGDGAEMEDVVGMRLSDVVTRIRGKAKTIVLLGIIRKGEKRAVRLERARTELVEDKAVGKVFDVEDGDRKTKVGVIELPKFYGNVGGGGNVFRSASNDVATLLRSFKKQKVQVVAIDLRLNGGGLLSEAIDLTGLFIDKGPVVQVKGRLRGGVNTHRDLDEGALWTGPLVVMTSAFSASASEIFAGAIKDYRRGLVVGDVSTHGKGTVQRVLDLGNLLRRSRRGSQPEKLGALKLTIEQFYLPRGDSTQRRGVPSDVVVPSFTNEIATTEAETPNTLPFDRVPAQEIIDYGLVNSELATALREKSKARRATSEHFQRLAKNISIYRQRKDRKSITLNLTKYKADQDSYAKSAEAAQEEVANEDKPTEIEKTEFLEEIMRIAADYSKMISSRVASKR